MRPLRFVSSLMPVAAALTLGGCSSGGGGGTGPAPTPPSALGLKTVATIPGAGGAHVPTFATSPAGDVDHLFVLDKAGIIYVVRHDTLQTKPFLDIHGIVTAGVGNEQGLLGMAFSPVYASDKSFYVCYNDLNWAVTVARYKVTANPEVADPNSGEIILSQYHHDFSNHNGGMIAFGPQGRLYISIGDGGSQGDPNGTGQNPADWLADILRVDVSGGGPGYTVPADNPFPNPAHPTAKPEVWCYGLRNPWRFSFDRANADLYIADVGQDAHEEIDVATAASGGGKALDFGWNIMEGNNCYSPSTACNPAGLTLPVLAYDHDATQDCVIGGYVYRGSAIPGLQGTYFYSDNYGRWLHSFRFVAGVASDQKDWNLSLAPSTAGVNSFGEDARGELYVCCSNGDIKRITP